MSVISRRVNAQPLIIVGTLFLVVIALSMARAVLIPLFLAILLSFLLGPVVRFVQRKGLKRIPAVLMVTVVAFILLGTLIIAILSQFVSLANNLPQYEDIILKKIRSMKQGESSMVSRVAHTIERVTKALEQSSGAPKKTPGSEPGPPLPVIVRTDLGEVISFYRATAEEIVRLLASTGAVIALVIVMLIFREELRDRFICVTGSTRLTVTTKALDEAARRISDYILRKSMVNGIFGAVIAAALVAIGVPFALLWGFLVAVLRFIPSLGIWLAAAPPLLLSSIAFEGWVPFALVAFVFVVVELLSINVFEPWLVGPQVGLLPVATMVSLTFWTWLWGPIGMLLAIPLTVCLAVLGKYVPHMSFLDVLLSNQPAMDVTLRYYQRLLANDQDEATEIVDAYLQSHSREAVYDNMLIPALSHARRDLASGELAKADLEFFFMAIGAILDDLQLSDTDQPTASVGDVAAVGCPVWDAGDKLALRMIAQQLQQRGHALEISNPGMLTSEVVEWIETRNPGIVCLAAISPGELAQTRFICKRLRTQFPRIKIVVARLGFPDDKDREVLEAAGADVVCLTIVETRNEVVQLLHLLPASASAFDSADRIKAAEERSNA